MQESDTRQRILKHLFLDIRRNGFQGLRADKVLAELAVTKGAMYHYFPNKQAIGMAVIDELIRPSYLDFYAQLSADTDLNPLDALQGHLRYLSEKATDEEVALGCPLNNLVQEMSPLDEGFRLRMKAIADAMVQYMAAAIRRGQVQGAVRPDIHPETVAQFLWAGIEGAYSLAKVRKDAQTFRTNASVLIQYLDGLRP
ncbi:MAG: TetR family transcriptional regulator C-terminal domain-containing protein [Saprospiraceae bacterium]|nr:TetR family transcriptional regulator C-terminal domain-containing protein [Saprospiraceae bacterium]